MTTHTTAEAVAPSDPTPASRGINMDLHFNKKFAVMSGAVLLVTAIVIALVLTLGSSGAHSISYKDGYASSGDTVVGGAPIDCSTATWDIPSGDNQAQWISGCKAGQSAANYNANHPGA